MIACEMVYIGVLLPFFPAVFSASIISIYKSLNSIRNGAHL